MWKWTRRASVSTGSVCLVAFVLSAIFTVHDWLVDDRRYLIDGGFGLVFLAVGITQFLRWRRTVNDMP
jgi:hypothetical protein